MATTKPFAFGWSNPKEMLATQAQPKRSVIGAVDKIGDGPLTEEFFEDYWIDVERMSSDGELAIMFNRSQINQIGQYRAFQENQRTKRAQQEAAAFNQERLNKNAVLAEELGFAAYSVPLDVCRDLFITAGYGGKWVDVGTMSSEHYLMARRLGNENLLEAVEVADPDTKSFSKRYRLKGT